MNRVNMNRFCRVCGEPYIGKKGNSVYCSVECRENPKAKYVRTKRAMIVDRPCDKCGRDRGPNHSICQTCVKATRREATF